MLAPESVAIIANVYKMEPDVVRQVLAELVDQTASDGSTFYCQGEFVPAGLDRLVAPATRTGDLKTKIDWRDHVDQSFLPADLQGNLK